MDTIEIALAVHDPGGLYSKFAGVTMASIFENTDSPVRIHLLTDESLSEKNREKYIRLTEDYRQSIQIYDIKIDELPNLVGLRRVTKGTLYRLKMPEVISTNIDKIIYLDADIVVNLDIQELWNEDFDDNAVIAIKDIDSSTAVCGKLSKFGVLSCDSYYNAGVMVWNLKKIRKKYEIYNQSMVFFEEYGRYCNGFTDQHASNAIFRDDVKFIDKKFNTFTRKIRNQGRQLEKIIYHFTDEKPHMDFKESFDRYFYELLEKTPWKDDCIPFLARGICARDDRINLYRKVVKKTRNRRIVFWGAYSKYTEAVVDLFDVDEQRDFYIDSNKEYVGTRIGRLLVNDKSIIDEMGNNEYFIIVISKLYYSDISSFLIDKGFNEHEDFIDGLELLDDGVGRNYVRV